MATQTHRWSSASSGRWRRARQRQRCSWPGVRTPSPPYRCHCWHWWLSFILAFASFPLKIAAGITSWFSEILWFFCCFPVHVHRVCLAVHHHRQLHVHGHLPVGEGGDGRAGLARSRVLRWHHRHLHVPEAVAEVAAVHHRALVLLRATLRQGDQYAGVHDRAHGGPVHHVLRNMAAGRFARRAAGPRLRRRRHQHLLGLLRRHDANRRQGAFLHQRWATRVHSEQQWNRRLCLCLCLCLCLSRCLSVCLYLTQVWTSKLPQRNKIECHQQDKTCCKHRGYLPHWLAPLLSGNMVEDLFVVLFLYPCAAYQMDQHLLDVEEEHTVPSVTHVDVPRHNNDLQPDLPPSYYKSEPQPRVNEAYVLSEMPRESVHL